MATQTTHYNLRKPALSDNINVEQDIGGNMDTIDTELYSQSQAIANTQSGLAYIVGNTNTTGSTLAVGQFVYVKGHSTIAEGLRTVTASISANGNITTSNTSACSEGGLNALNSKLASFQRESVSNFTANNDTWTPTKSGIAIAINSEAVSGVWYAYVYHGSSSIAAMSGTEGTGGLSHSITFPVSKGNTYKLIIGGITAVGVYLFPIYN